MHARLGECSAVYIPTFNFEHVNSVITSQTYSTDTAVTATKREGEELVLCGWRLVAGERSIVEIDVYIIALHLLKGSSNMFQRCHLPCLRMKMKLSAAYFFLECFPRAPLNFSQLAQGCDT